MHARVGPTGAGLEIALHEPRNPFGNDGLFDPVIRGVVRLEVKDGSTVDGIEASNHDGVSGDRDDGDRCEADRVGTILGALGEYADERHGGQAARATGDVSGWIEGGLVEVSDDQEMRELFDAEKACPKLRQYFYSRGDSAPVLIGLRDNLAANVSDCVQGD